MSSRASVSVDDDTCEMERICVAHIRMQTGDHVAILGEFREADRLLAFWIDRAAQDFLEFRFEIAFQDGFVFRCQHDFWRRSRLRPSLSKLVRKAFSGQAKATGALPRSPEQYEIDSF
jgi:hypothetical protein